MTERLLATFRSTHGALAAERRVRAAGLAGDLIPLPALIRSSCGFGLLLEGPDPPPLIQEDPLVEGLWRVEDPPPGQHRRHYEPYHPHR